MKENATKDSDNRLKHLFKASLYAIIADIVLILLKYFLSKYIGSRVLLADSLHSLGDLGISLMVLISIIINNKFSQNKLASYAERLAALMISVILIFASWSYVFKAFLSPVPPEPVSTGLPLVISLAGILIAIVITFKMSIYKHFIGKKHSSPAFEAEGMHTFADFFTSVGAFLSLVLLYFGLNIESVMSFLIGLAIMRIGLKLFIQSFGLFVFILRQIGKGIAILWRWITPAKFRQWLIRIGNSIWDVLKPIFANEALISLLKKIGSSTQTIYKGFTGKVGAIGFLDFNWHKKKFALITRLFIALIILLYIGLGIYSIETHESGVELLLGKVNGISKPGLHIHAPPPFGGLKRVDTRLEKRLDMGFRTILDDNVQEPEAYLWEYAHASGRYKKVAEEAITITGDETLLDCNFLCYYHITDPVAYAMQTDNPHEILRSLFSHSVHRVIGRHSLDSVLIGQRKAIQDEVFIELSRISSEMNLGINLNRVYMRETHPPIYVVPKYRSVATAREEMDEIIHLANAYSNEMLPKARADSIDMIADAQAYAIEESLKAFSEATSFSQNQEAYKRYWRTSSARLRWEKLEDLLKGRDITILPNGSRKRVFPLRNEMNSGEKYEKK